MAAQAVTRIERPLSPRVQEALGELVGVVKGGLLALSVGLGLGVLAELMARRLEDVRLAVLMLDGIELKRRTNVVMLGITSDGLKIPLRPWEGSTENATVAPLCQDRLRQPGFKWSSQHRLVVEPRVGDR